MITTVYNNSKRKIQMKYSLKKLLLQESPQEAKLAKLLTSPVPHAVQGAQLGGERRHVHLREPSEGRPAEDDRDTKQPP